MDSKMDPAFGEGPKETPTSESGKTVRLTATECTLGSMETGTKANSKNALSMAKDLKSLLTETLTKELTSMASLTATANTFGAMEVPTRVNLSKV